MHKATFPLAALVFALAGAPRAFACSCACDGSYTVEDYIDKATVIVVGRVLELKSKPGPSDPLTKQFLSLLGITDSDADQVTVISSCGAQWVRVAVTDQLKGERRAEVTLAREAIGTACDVSFPLVVGEAYLLFGVPGRDGETLYLSGCSPSAPLARAKRIRTKVHKQLARVS
jgi:hypothetical protein